MKNDIFKLYDNALLLCKEKDAGDFMCEKLRELNGKTAESFLRETEQTDNVVVDVERILQNANIRMLPRTFDDIEAIEGKEVAGLVLSNGDEIGIFYDAESTATQQKFIIAHELGHCCLHGDTLKAGYVEFLHKDGFENQHETAASAFAARLLIQKTPLQSIYHKLVLPVLDALADIFEVPPHLMEFRLKELGMKYYKKKGDRFVESKCTHDR